MLTAHPLPYADADDAATPLVGHFACDDAAAGEPRPAVLVAPAFMGLDDHARGRADRLAAELGYAALAVDVYGNGRLANNQAEAVGLMRPFVDDPASLRRRMRAGLAALRRQPQVDPARVAAIGFCFGGRAAIELARDGADVLAVVSFHGTLDTKVPAVAGVMTAKVLSCTGAADGSIGPDRVRDFGQEMSAAGVDWQTTVYGGVVHAFTNPSANVPGRAMYDAAADRRSWAAMRELLAEVFG